MEPDPEDLRSGPRQRGPFTDERTTQLADNLWTYPWITATDMRRAGVDPRRHLRWDETAATLYYVIKRSIPPRSGWVGRFAVDSDTLRWLNRQLNREKAARVYVVLVENFDDESPVIHHCAMLDEMQIRLAKAPRLTSSDGHDYWWVDDKGNVPRTFRGPWLRNSPF